MVEDVGAIFAQQAQIKGIELACFVPHDLPVAVCADPVRLRQILTNLVGNAIKFTEAGEVVARVELVAEDEGVARMRFAVKDTGIGISQDVQDRIFGAFSQADSSTTRRFGGTGLGLAIAKRLVEKMGGALSLDSAAGLGSTFSFELPLAKQDAHARGVLGAVAHLHGLRVLVVDDNATNREILAHQLAGWKMRHADAEGGTQALAMMHAARQRGEAFELAILDMHMPEMDGFELAQAIKRDLLLAATPMLMLSSVTLAANAAERREAGIERYLTKPVRQSDLFNAIATVIGSRELVTPASLAAGGEQTAAQPALRPGAGGRVLLAEDNPVNQQVALAMMELLGVVPKVVGDGREALDALEHEAFDGILMDCQMPELDGYAATAEIRRREAVAGGVRRIPIIALTANAVAGDREQCLAVGMDDYLSKPFSHHQLTEILNRWLPDRPAVCAAASPDRGASAAPAEAPPADDEDAAVNRSVLDKILMLGPTFNFALLRKVVGIYCTDAPARLDRMAAAVAGDNPAVLSEAAHAMKSASANLGAERLAAMCKELEMLGRSATTAGAQRLVVAAEQEYQRVVVALNAISDAETEDAAH